MAIVIVNAGSNKGNRRLNLSRAVKLLMDNFGPVELSHVVESEPWGFDSTNSFLNLAIMFQTEESPEKVLETLQKIERNISADSHRNSDGSYRDREIDLDIIAIDAKVIDTEMLKVPHQHLEEREFFLVPLEELATGWRHPLNGLTATEMIENLRKKKDGQDNCDRQPENSMR